MAKAARSKPKRERFRYVVEVVFETNRKWLKQDVRQFVGDALVNDTFDGSGIVKTRVRKCDLD